MERAEKLLPTASNAEKQLALVNCIEFHQVEILSMLLRHQVKPNISEPKTTILLNLSPLSKQIIKETETQRVNSLMTLCLKTIYHYKEQFKPYIKDLPLHLKQLLK